VCAGEEKLGSGCLGFVSRGASVLEAFETFELVEDVVVKFGGSRNVVVFVTCGVGVVGCGEGREKAATGKGRGAREGGTAATVMAPEARSHLMSARRMVA
jgi:hypothetical protein